MSKHAEGEGEGEAAVATSVRLPDYLFATSIVRASVDCIKVISLDGKLLFMNEGGLCAMEIPNFQAVANQHWAYLWPERTRPKVELAMRAALVGDVGRFQGYCPTARGTPAWWDVIVTAMLNDGGKVEWLLAVSRNITDLQSSEPG